MPHRLVSGILAIGTCLLQSQAHLRFIPIRFEPILDRYMHSSLEIAIIKPLKCPF
ncbi:hypothetical protein SCLCIDRAFT_1214676 [Scleroderma citrinum Foug A]|uniref:Uncharacterized protein n=1 Tax=Scleroderma citrinum Foug A TaxID=1036808 RepID=A0A0C3E4B2_9AGAM|nr:hypothetical protein SCLCIDRAFT_1214676 [Scleroderma citrinum Foug A]